MKNFEKYKDATERSEAFWRDYRGLNTPDEVVLGFSKWLDLEAEEEKPLPCPFCGGICREEESEIVKNGYMFFLQCQRCDYRSPLEKTIQTSISKHNRVARAAKEAKDKEAK